MDKSNEKREEIPNLDHLRVLVRIVVEKVVSCAFVNAILIDA